MTSCRFRQLRVFSAVPSRGGVVLFGFENVPFAERIDGFTSDLHPSAGPISDDVALIEQPPHCARGAPDRGASLAHRVIGIAGPFRDAM